MTKRQEVRKKNAFLRMQKQVVEVNKLIVSYKENKKDIPSILINDISRIKKEMLNIEFYLKGGVKKRKLKI